MFEKHDITKIIYEIDKLDHIYDYKIYHKEFSIPCWNLVRHYLYKIVFSISMPGKSLLRPKVHRSILRNAMLCYDAFKHRPKKSAAVDVLFFLLSLKTWIKVSLFTIWTMN